MQLLLALNTETNRKQSGSSGLEPGWQPSSHLLGPWENKFERGTFSSLLSGYI